jgi:PDZ domain-containing protein
MATSQDIASAVAEKELGLPVVTRDNGVLADNVYSDVPAASKIYPADVIVSVNGKPTLTLDALTTAMSGVKPGDVVYLTLRRGTETVRVNVKTVADRNDPTRPLIGIIPEQSKKIIKLPVKVNIDSQGIGGPSAGLALTLEIMRKLGRDVTHGYRVAATGEIRTDGTVFPIGAVEQKVYGVRQAGAQVFLVPAAQGNAAEAKRYAGPDLMIIPVTSLKQALRRLAHLPKLPQK